MGAQGRGVREACVRAVYYIGLRCAHDACHGKASIFSGLGMCGACADYMCTL